ncbi:unnamed protein product [Protopolystoma xenopodis]|uniref:Uncharacterized protein n=1 Tax=Protopolystoma xenopodis TaxID=117903 RepID=A0A3S5BEL1_9PLAT|nr:unnamed protein product [Protopolystoma xenopodis]
MLPLLKHCCWRGVLFFRRKGYAAIFWSSPGIVFQPGGCIWAFSLGLVATHSVKWCRSGREDYLQSGCKDDIQKDLEFSLQSVWKISLQSSWEEQLEHLQIGSIIFRAAGLSSECLGRLPSERPEYLQSGWEDYLQKDRHSQHAVVTVEVGKCVTVCLHLITF